MIYIIITWLRLWVCVSIRKYGDEQVYQHDVHKEEIETEQDKCEVVVHLGNIFMLFFHKHVKLQK